MKELKKDVVFAFLNRLKLTNEELSLLREWLMEYSAKSCDTLPCMVEYVGYDPDGEQNGFSSVSTVHYSKLEYGEPILAYLGVKIVFAPILGHPTITTVADLMKEADEVGGTHPLTRADWNKFTTHQKSYMDLNKILKGLKRPVNLPDIRDHIYYLHDTTPECTLCTRLDVKTGETTVVPIAEMDLMLCVAD